MPTTCSLRALAACLMLAALVGCGTQGPPDNGDAEGALRDFFEHQNDRGGIRINLGSAGGFKDIRFDIRLHGATVHGCTGKDRVYVCQVSYLASFPPVKDERELIRTEATFFDGPGGWRVVE